MTAVTMRDLLNKRMTTMTPFLDTKLEIRKLSVGEVTGIQDKIAEDNSERNDLDLPIEIIQLATTGAEDITREEFDEFPLDEVIKLSSAIMKYSGIDPAAGK